MSRRALIVMVVVLLAAFLPPFVNLQRFQARIAQTISASIGRPVHFSAVHVRLVPQPAFVFRDFLISEDPAFGLEPMLRADEVTARLRLTSLWQGRLEISRLSFDAPSLNLTRNRAGRWNVGGSLQQAATVPAAPTSAPRQGPAPRFPYIEAADARVNFKFEQTKQAFSLIETDFSLWLASPHHWEMRLEARPVRTDASLGDTGRIRADASLVREHSESLEQLPFKANIRWSDARLGQLTWLLSGKDRGWRGDVGVRIEAQGTPQLVHLRTRARLDNFRRYDISVTNSAAAELDCSSDLHRQSSGESLHFEAESIACELPVGAGKITASGRASWADQAYDVRVQANDVPLAGPLEAYRRAKLDVSDSLHAAGMMRADLRFTDSISCPAGWLSLAEARVEDTARKVDLQLGNVMLSAPAVSRGAKLSQAASCLTTNVVNLDVGGKTPLGLQLLLGTDESRLLLRGQADSEPLLAVAKSFGLLARDYHATGKLTLDAALAMHASGFTHANWLGSVQSSELILPQGLTLHNVVLALKGDTVELQRFTATVSELQTTLSGSITWPVRCGGSPCPLSFALNATSLDADTLNGAFNPRFRKKNWIYLPRFLGGEGAKQNPASVLFSFDGRGTLQVDRLTIRKLVIDHFTTTAEWQGERLMLTAAKGNVLGGRMDGEAALDFTDGLRTRGKASVTNADLLAVAGFFGGDWMKGRVSGSGTFEVSGTTAQEMSEAARADLGFTGTNGSLRRLAETGDLNFRKWSGEATLRASELLIPRSTLETSAGALRLSGKVFDRQSLDLVLEGSATRTLISGTLAAPKVTTAAAPAYSASNPQDETTNRKK